MRTTVMTMTAGAVAIVLALGIYRAGAASAPPTPTAQAQEEQRGGISVGGEGTVEARPDTAHINLGFMAENASVAVAHQQAAEQMDAVAQRITALGVAAKDMQTANYSIYRDQERKVFVVSNDVRVVIRDIQASSKLLDGAVAAGANSVSGISFTIEDRAALEKQAREKAMQNAREKAVELARLGDVTLGKPITIAEAAAPGPIPYAEAAVRSAAPADVATPVKPGELTVRMSVNVTYAIKR